jgi:hypothetical protein
MIILAACFTLLSGIIPKGDSSTFSGQSYRFASYITIQLQRVFPQHYRFLKNAEFWLTKFLEWLKAVVPSQAGEDRRQREHVMNNGENTK